MALPMENGGFTLENGGLTMENDDLTMENNVPKAEWLVMLMTFIQPKCRVSGFDTRLMHSQYWNCGIETIP